MEPEAPALPTDADITATGVATIRGGFTAVVIDKTRKTEDLLNSLKNNRKRLQSLKAEYVKAVEAGGGIDTPSTKRRMIFHELVRIYAAMEGLKNELTQRGVNFEVDANDHEHPNAAYKRITTAANYPSGGLMFLYLVLSAIIFFLWFFTSNEWKQAGSFFGQERAVPMRPYR
ncbi:MAG: hypothetical protein J2P48_24015 [Alphaproteobacteria bacterium]|nr:hypothetical protein [Alphaproteobacteria bacterium]